MGGLLIGGNRADTTTVARTSVGAQHEGGDRADCTTVTTTDDGGQIGTGNRGGQYGTGG